MYLLCCVRCECVCVCVCVTSRRHIINVSISSRYLMLNQPRRAHVSYMHSVHTCLYACVQIVSDIYPFFIEWVRLNPSSTHSDILMGDTLSVYKWTQASICFSACDTFYIWSFSASYTSFLPGKSPTNVCDRCDKSRALSVMRFGVAAISNTQHIYVYITHARNIGGCWCCCCCFVWGLSACPASGMLFIVCWCGNTRVAVFAVTPTSWQFDSEPREYCTPFTRTMFSDLAKK